LTARPLPIRTHRLPQAADWAEFDAGHVDYDHLIPDANLLFLGLERQPYSGIFVGCGIVAIESFDNARKAFAPCQTTDTGCPLRRLQRFRREGWKFGWNLSV